MVKETIKGAEIALANKGVFIGEKGLINLCKEEFEIKQDVKILGNRIWKLQKEKVALLSKISQIETVKDKIFINMGLKFVKPIDKEEE